LKPGPKPTTNPAQLLSLPCVAQTPRAAQPASAPLTPRTAQTSLTLSAALGPHTSPALAQPNASPRPARTARAAHPTHSLLVRSLVARSHKTNSSPTFPHEPAAKGPLLRVARSATSLPRGPPQLRMTHQPATPMPDLLEVVPRSGSRRAICAIRKSCARITAAIPAIHAGCARQETRSPFN